jgi:hypothetical protein
MIVHCAGFGSHWYRMTGTDQDGSYVPSRSVLFNTTGIAHTGNPANVSKRWSFAGEVRIHPSGFCFMRKPLDLLGVNSKALLTPGINGKRRLLLYRSVPKSFPVDAVLLAVQKSIYGEIDLTSDSSDWRRNGVQLISSSWSSREQETLLLLPKNSSIRTDEGIWMLEWTGKTGRKVVQLCPAGAEVIERDWSQAAVEHGQFA